MKLVNVLLTCFLGNILVAQAYTVKLQFADGSVEVCSNTTVPNSDVLYFAGDFMQVTVDTCQQDEIFHDSFESPTQHKQPTTENNL